MSLPFLWNHPHALLLAAEFSRSYLEILKLVTRLRIERLLFSFFLMADVLLLCCCPSPWLFFLLFVGINVLSSGWCGSSFSITSFATPSLAISEHDQNTFMLSVHPIWMLFGTTMCGSGYSGVMGDMHAKFHLYSSFTNTRQNPSCMPAFANKTGSDLGTIAIEWILLCSAFPMCWNDSSGAILTVVWFTDSVFTLLSVISFDRFCMILNGLDFFGIAAIGMIFSCGRCFSLKSFHFNIVQ